MPRFVSSALSLTLVFTVCLASSALAQQAPRPGPAPNPQVRRTVKAERLQPGETITLDGRLDEAVWTRAPKLDDFVQVDPNNGQAPSELTDVRVAFSADALYLGVFAHDSAGTSRLVRYQKRRDELLQSDDKVQWTIDTFLDGRSGYFFETNPSGAMADALIGISGQNRPWDGIWNERVQRGPDGWSFEVEIPFRTLNFDPKNDTWGFNVNRTVSRVNEQSIWMGWARNQGVQRMTNAGRITGLTSVSQGHGLDIKPYVLGTVQDAPARRQTAEGDAQVGVDMFFNATPALRTNLTINTDFAQTEVDQRQVNLTQFSLLYPEKRDFFLDGATFFDFASPGSGAGGNNTNRNADTGTDLVVNPFFSRRIGLSDTGDPQKIVYGMKATGQLAGQDVGVIQVRTGEDNGAAGEDFTVARVRHRMLRQSYLGATYSRRDTTVSGVDTTQTLGVDGRLGTNTFRRNQNLAVTGWYLKATTPRATSGNEAYGATLSYPNDRWNANFDVRSVGANFTPSVGFVSRNAYRRYLPTVTFAPRPRNNRIVRQYDYKITVDVQTTLDNVKIARNITFQPFMVEMAAGDQFAVQAIQRSERLDVPFVLNIKPGRRTVLPRGSGYDFRRYQANWNTSNRRTVAFNGRIEVGDFYSGTRREFVSNVTFRLLPGVFVYTGMELNHISLPQATFDTKLFRLVPEWQFTPFVTWVNNFQYDTVSGVLGWQSRFRWIVRPGSDIYVVYTNNWLDDPIRGQFIAQDRRFSTKALYTYRF